MAVESEIEVLKSVVNKLDTSLEKISEVSNSIGKLLAVHDQRIINLEKDADARSDDVKELHSRITNQTKEIVDKISQLERTIENKMRENADVAFANIREHAALTQLQHDNIQNNTKSELSKLDERINVLDRWKWYITGIGAVIIFIITNIKDFMN